MTPEEASQRYRGPKGQHTAFDAEFDQLACKYQVQAVCFYGGFGRPVAIASVASRRSLVTLLKHVPGLAQTMLDGAVSVLNSSSHFWVRERRETSQ